MMNKKPCKICKVKKKYANTNLCWDCYRAREKNKKEEKALKKKLRKESTKKFKENLRKSLMNIAWKLMSEYVRRRDKGVCFTCRKINDWRKCHAGHRHHGKLNFDEMNINCQCNSCNTYLHGNLGSYERHLIEKYRLEEVKELEKRAWEKGNNYSIEELKDIINNLTNRLKDLDKKDKEKKDEF
jgi:hypothetical protein